jgi:hypothetical protein
VRADFLVYDQRPKDARILLEQVLREDPSNASAHETMGYLEFRQGNLAEFTECGARISTKLTPWSSTQCNWILAIFTIG